MCIPNNQGRTVAQAQVRNTDGSLTILPAQSQQAIDLLKSKLPEYEENQAASFGITQRKGIGIERLKNPTGVPLITKR